MEEKLKDFYGEKNIKRILDSVSNPGLRVWKIEDLNGNFRQATKKINSVKKLKEFLGDQPSKVYVSVAEFLQPGKVFGKVAKKSQWVIGDSLFLKSDLLFDFDHDDQRVALKDARKVYKFMEKKEGYKLKDIRVTNRGFHLLYEDLKPIKEPCPLKRLQLTEKKRRELVDKLPPLITIDDNHKDVIADQFRVHAAIGTIKADTGYKVKEVSTKSFLNNSRINQMREIL